MRHISRILFALLAATLMALSFGAHAQDESAIMQGRQQVREAAQDTLSTLYEYLSLIHISEPTRPY